MAEKKKQQIVTFKVDDSLYEALERISNRSEFIRSAILAALKGTCPLCQGTGRLTVEEKRHWEVFAQHHVVRTCNDCHAVHLVCLDGCSDASPVHAASH